MTTNDYGGSFGDDKNVLKLMVVMAAHAVNILKATGLYPLNG